jgi:KUP system potassium uptake protein
MIFWSVMIVVTITYVLLAMRADNDGEGGIVALITLIRRLESAPPRDAGQDMRPDDRTAR